MLFPFTAETSVIRETFQVLTHTLETWETPEDRVDEELTRFSWSAQAHEECLVDTVGQCRDTWRTRRHPDLDTLGE